MPQVPVYGGPQVAADPLRPVQARALDVSSGTRAIGQGLADLGEGIDRYQETKAQTRANEIETSLTDEYNRWADTEQHKAVNQNASTWRSRVEAWWEDARGRYGKDLDPYAARKVTEILARRRSIALNEAGRYQSVQEERYADSTAFSAMESAASSAVRSGAYDVELGRTRDLVYEMAARKSLDKDQRDALMAEQVRKFHRRVIDNLSAEQGLAYYDANAADIEDKRLRDTLERSIEVERKQREADAEKAKREADERVLDSAWSLYAKRQAIPQSVIAALPGREAAQLMDAIESRAAREAKGEVVRTDPAEYNRVMLDITEGRRVDLRPYSERFESADMDRLVKLQQDMATPDKVPEVATLTQQLNTFTTGFNDEKKKQFTDAVQTEISRQQQAKGRTLTFEERRAVMDAQYMEGEVLSGKWYSADSDKRFYEVPSEDRAAWVPEISDSDRALVVEALQKVGIAAPTEAQIVERYKLVKGF